MCQFKLFVIKGNNNTKKSTYILKEHKTTFIGDTFLFEGDVHKADMTPVIDIKDS